MIRTGYSFHHAIGNLPDVISRIKEIGWTCAPICDLNSTFGFVRWTKLCEKAGLKPIYGVELNVTPSLGEKKPIFDQWKFLAIDSLKPLHDLIALATSNPGREPSITYRQALAAEGLIKISGEKLLINCLDPNLSDFALGLPDGYYLSKEFHNFNSENFFVGLSPGLPKGTFRKAARCGLQFIAIGNNVYPRAEDRELYRVALGRRANTQSYPQHILSSAEWIDSAKWLFPESSLAFGRDPSFAAILNRPHIFNRCNAKLEKASLLIPEKPKSLRELCLEGARRVGVDLESRVYAERLDKELNLIAEKNFEDYFFIIADVVNWAKERMLVGPARGSSCGSLVCYLLDITAIDPIRYGLIFERFIDTTRTDLPDIDLDFDDQRRSLVFDYLERKYGRERVARLGTVGMFQEKSAAIAVSNSLRLSKWNVAKDEVGEKFVSRLIDHPSNAGQHAAGIVITQSSITDYVAVDKRTNSTMCDKEDAERLNLLKIDALGLTQLSIFQRTLDLLNKPKEYLYSIPLNDPKAFEVLNKGHFSGIFQFAGQALQSLTKQMRVESIEDMIAITSLARPGPMDTGASQHWIARRTGREAVSYLDPLFEPVLKETLGIVVFQEQIMRIAREIGNLSWEDVNKLRRVIGKSQGADSFDFFGDRWKKGALENGLNPQIIDQAWNDLCTFGRYGFNKSHAVAYSVVSYWCCWLKAYHSVEFAAATLDSEKDPQKQLTMLRELAAEGIYYIPVDAERSIDKWIPIKENNKARLVGPLTQIKGFGPAIVREVIDARQREIPLRPAVSKKLLAARTEIDSLFPIRDAINRVAPDLAALGITSQPIDIKQVQCGILGDVVILAMINKIAKKDENDPLVVAKRGYSLKGHASALGMFFRDDTDEIYAKIGRYDFERQAPEIIERGGIGNALYAVKGQCPRGFRMLTVSKIMFLGFMND